MKYLKNTTLLFFDSESTCEVGHITASSLEFSVSAFQVGSGTRYFLYYNNFFVIMKPLLVRRPDGASDEPFGLPPASLSGSSPLAPPCHSSASGWPWGSFKPFQEGSWDLHREG